MSDLQHCGRSAAPPPSSVEALRRFDHDAGLLRRRATACDDEPVPFAVLTAARLAFAARDLAHANLDLLCDSVLDGDGRPNPRRLLFGSWSSHEVVLDVLVMALPGPVRTLFGVRVVVTPAAGTATVQVHDADGAVPCRRTRDGRWVAVRPSAGWLRITLDPGPQQRTAWFGT